MSLSPRIPSMRRILPQCLGPSPRRPTTTNLHSKLADFSTSSKQLKKVRQDPFKDPSKPSERRMRKGRLQAPRNPEEWFDMLQEGNSKGKFQMAEKYGGKVGFLKGVSGELNLKGNGRVIDEWSAGDGKKRDQAESESWEVGGRAHGSRISNDNSLGSGSLPRMEHRESEPTARATALRSQQYNRRFGLKSNSEGLTHLQYDGDVKHRPSSAREEQLPTRSSSQHDIHTSFPRIARRSSGDVSYRIRREDETRNYKMPLDSLKFGEVYPETKLASGRDNLFFDHQTNTSPPVKTTTWQPTKKLTYPAMAGLRALHQADPVKYDKPYLSEKFGISYEAVRRILKSRFREQDAVGEYETRDLAGTKWDVNPSTSEDVSPVPVLRRAFERAKILATENKGGGESQNRYG